MSYIKIFILCFVGASIISTVAYLVHEYLWDMMSYEVRDGIKIFFLLVFLSAVVAFPIWCLTLK